MTDKAAAAPTPEPRRPSFRRILLAFDSASGSLAALDSAAALAARLEAELTGLFVEDIDLLRLAEHPEVTAYGVFSSGRQALDAGTVERRYRLQVAVSRRAMQQAAERRRITSHFEVRRGRVAAEVLASAEDADLVIVDWRSGDLTAGRPGRPSRPGAIARAVAEGAARSVLLLRHDHAPKGPILVVYDGSASADRVLDIAIDMAESDNETLDVVMLTGRLDAVRDWQRRIGERLAGHGLAVRFHQLPGAGPEPLCRAARRNGVRLMVLGAGLPQLTGEQARRLLEGIDCSVLLVR